MVVFGDYPYSSEQLRRLPAVVDQINHEPNVRYVFHLGDIKGAGPCTSAYFARIKRAFDQFTVPLIYTFGDNEWTDCVKPENGSSDPFERLKALRDTFVPTPGQTLGQPVDVDTDVDHGYPENVMFVHESLSFGVFHAVGSRNGLEPWPGHREPTSTQLQEEHARAASAQRVVQTAFDAARSSGAAAVVLMTQADFFALDDDNGPPPGYRSIVKAIAHEAARFSGEVYLFNGDSHEYATGNPLATGSRWVRIYGVAPVDNLTRVTIDGDENATSYLKLAAWPTSKPVLTWTQVPLVAAKP